MRQVLQKGLEVLVEVGVLVGSRTGCGAQAASFRVAERKAGAEQLVRDKFFMLPWL